LMIFFRFLPSIGPDAKAGTSDRATQYPNAYTSQGYEDTVKAKKFLHLVVVPGFLCIASSITENASENKLPSTNYM
jgi:hypothetical protein